MNFKSFNIFCTFLWIRSIQNMLPMLIYEDFLQNSEQQFCNFLQYKLFMEGASTMLPVTSSFIFNFWICYCIDNGTSGIFALNSLWTVTIFLSRSQNNWSISMHCSVKVHAIENTKGQKSDCMKLITERDKTNIICSAHIIYWFFLV